MSRSNETPKHASVGIRIAAVGVTLLLFVGSMEIFLRIVYSFEETIKERLGLLGAPKFYNEFEEPDPRDGQNWLLKPGFTSTMRELIAAKDERGQTFGARRLRAAQARYAVPDEQVVFRVNAEGFKGPELVQPRRPIRILAIGDSCTFGTEIDWYSYPRALERDLRSRGFDVEVVNAGVGGYSPSNVLARIERYQELRPDWTLIYIGWNALFGERTLGGIQHYLYSARLIEAIHSRLQANRNDAEFARYVYERPKRVDRSVLDAFWLRRWEPGFLPDVERIVDAMEAVRSRVVILTLPGLFSTREEPSARALEIGHLPQQTDNPYVLAGISERYNERLRELARARELPLVDLEAWADRTLEPRDTHFVDSVHLDEAAQVEIGAQVAAAMATLLSAESRVD